MADAFIYHNSLEELDNEFLFENKQYIAVSDSNGGFYASSQVKFELSQIANSGRFVSWQNSYLVVPLVVNLETPGNTVAGGTLENAFSVSLKNGYHQLINSMDVQIGNNSVVNLTNFSNMAINYKILSTASKEDEHNRLPSMNVFMDTAESISYRQTGSKTGLGETNNVIKDTIFNPDAGWGFTSSGVNRGRQKRMLQTSYNAVGVAHSVFHGTSNVNCALSGKSNVVFTPPIGNGATTSIQFNVLATIPLAQLHDLFTKLPMVRGMNMNLVLNLNAQCSSIITLGGVGTTFTNCVTTSQNGVFPAMLSPLETGNGSVMSGCASVMLSVDIGKSVNNAFSHPTMTNCRLYAYVYSMSPIAEQKYLSMMPQKLIQYEDVLSFQILNVSPGQNVNKPSLSTGISRLRGLLIVPQLSASVNGLTVLGQYTAGVQIGSPMNTPFSSSPATCLPGAIVSNFNVQLSGSNFFQQNFQYGFEHYLNEVRQSNSLNGGIPLALSSGLLTQIDWENEYRQIYVNLSRKSSQADDDAIRSVVVTFTNLSPAVVDYYIFAFFLKEKLRYQHQLVL